MSGSLAPRSSDILSGSGGSAGVAQLIAALAPIFLGQTGGQNQNVSGQTSTSGTTGTTGSTTGSTSQTSTTSSTSDPGIIAALLQSFNQANTLSNDNTATQSLINDIIHQSLLAFGPTIAQANSAGLYNSSTLGLLAGNAAAEAAQKGSVAALNFKQNEQQIAASIGSSLLGAIKNTTSTGNTNTAQDTTQQQVTQQTGQQAQQTQTTTKTNPQVNNLFNSPAATGILGLLGTIFGPSLLKGITGSSPSDLGGDAIDWVKRLFGGGADVFPNVDSAGLGLAGAPSSVLENANLSNLSNVAQTVADTTGRGLLAVNPNIISDSSNVVAAANNPLLGPIDINNPLGGVGTASGVGNSGVSGLNVGPGAGFVDNASTFVDTAPEIGNDVALNFANSGAEVGAETTGGLGFLTDTSGSVLNVPSDISTIFDTGAGFGQLATDIANPIAGFLGSELGKLLAPEGKSGGQTIGSAIGGAATGIAALAGAPLGPLGVLGGALFGSLIGGGFGPNKKNTYSFAGLQLNADGTLALGNQVEQAYGGDSIRNPIQNQLDIFNNFLRQSGIKVINDTVAGNDFAGAGNFVTGKSLGPITLGVDFTQSDKGQTQSPNLGRDISDIFYQLQFSSEDPTINAALAGKQFNTPDQLVAAATGQPIPDAPTDFTHSIAQQVAAATQGIASGAITTPENYHTAQYYMDYGFANANDPNFNPYETIPTPSSFGGTEAGGGGG